jgi:hypothetical protein
MKVSNSIEVLCLINEKNHWNFRFGANIPIIDKNLVQKLKLEINQESSIF